MNRIRLILAGVLGGGILLMGIGTGVALKEYSSLEYSGEHIIGDVDMQTESGELHFAQADEGESYHIYSGAEDVEIIEDAAMPDAVVQYEVTYNKNTVDIAVHGTAEEQYYSIVQWKANSDFEAVMKSKDEILRELKQNKIGSYRTLGIKKIKFTPNPHTVKMLAVE